jgi:hypothetical protein
MIRNAGELISAIEQGARQMGLGPEARILARKGDFGAEHAIEHIKVRQGRFGLEIVVQIAEVPNDG